MAATKLASKTRIYLDAKQMLDIAIDVVRNFPKSQRPVFGDRGHVRPVSAFLR